MRFSILPQKHIQQNLSQNVKCFHFWFVGSELITIRQRQSLDSSKQREHTNLCCWTFAYFESIHLNVCKSKCHLFNMWAYFDEILSKLSIKRRIIPKIMTFWNKIQKKKCKHKLFISLSVCFLFSHSIPSNSFAKLSKKGVFTNTWNGLPFLNFYLYGKNNWLW